MKVSEYNLVHKLNSWFDVVEKKVMSLLIWRHMFWEWRQIIESNDNMRRSNSFFDMISHGYVALVVMNIRSLIDNDPKSISFANLLNKIASNYKIFNREWYVSLWGKPSKPVVIVDHLPEEERESIIKQAEDFTKKDHFRRANEWFDKFSGKNQEFTNVKKIKNDLCVMRRKAINIQHFADRHIAHIDRRGLKIIPKLGELDDCISAFEKLCLEYSMFFRGGSASSLLPTWQYNWKKIFDYAWHDRGRHEVTSRK